VLDKFSLPPKKKKNHPGGADRPFVRVPCNMYAICIKYSKPIHSYCWTAVHTSCALGECHVRWRSSTTLLILLGWRGDQWSSHKRGHSSRQWACGPGCAPRAAGGGAAGGACVRILPWPRARGSTAADTRTPPIASRERPVSFWLAAWVWFRTCASVCVRVFVCIRVRS